MPLPKLIFDIFKSPLTRPIALVSILSFGTSVAIYFQIRLVIGFYEQETVNEYLFFRRWTAIVDAFVLLGSFNVIIEKVKKNSSRNLFASYSLSVILAAFCIVFITILYGLSFPEDDKSVIIQVNYIPILLIAFGYSIYVLNYLLLKIHGQFVFPDFLQFIFLGVSPILLLYTGTYFDFSGGFLALCSYLPVIILGIGLSFLNLRTFFRPPDIFEVRKFIVFGFPRFFHFNFQNVVFFFLFSFIFSFESDEVVKFFGIFLVFTKLTETIFEGYSRTIISLLKFNQRDLDKVFKSHQLIFLVTCVLCGFLWALPVNLMAFIFTLLFPSEALFPGLQKACEYFTLLIPFYVFIILRRPHFDPVNVWKKFSFFLISILTMNQLIFLPYISSNYENNYMANVVFLFTMYSIFLLITHKKTIK